MLRVIGDLLANTGVLTYRLKKSMHVKTINLAVETGGEGFLCFFPKDYVVPTTWSMATFIQNCEFMYRTSTLWSGLVDIYLPEGAQVTIANSNAAQQIVVANLW